MGKRSKAELIEFILKISCANQSARQLARSRFDLNVPTEELIAETRISIDAATYFNDRETNSNFDYDIEAYQTVERNFTRLIHMGKYAEVMELSLKLMWDGSRQVECSDEGMMTEEIEACLTVVIEALAEGVVPAGDVITWCERMSLADRVGFICDEEVRALRERFAQS